MAAALSTTESPGFMKRQQKENRRRVWFIFYFFLSPLNKHRRSDPGRGMFPVYPRKAQLDPMYLQDGLE